MDNIPSPDSAVILPTWSRESTPLEAIANSPGLFQTYFPEKIFRKKIIELTLIRESWKKIQNAGPSPSVFCGKKSRAQH